jgi:hypothetical protein
MLQRCVLHSSSGQFIAVRTSETLVYFNETTQRYSPESCHLHTHHHENLKSHLIGLPFLYAMLICEKHTIRENTVSFFFDAILSQSLLQLQ